MDSEIAEKYIPIAAELIEVSRSKYFSNGVSVYRREGDLNDNWGDTPRFTEGRNPSFLQRGEIDESIEGEAFELDIRWQLNGQITSESLLVNKNGYLLAKKRY